MNLYLISQTENEGYDIFDSAVVAAENEETARNMDPYSGKPMNWGENIYDWCYKVESVSVKYLGIAAEGIAQGVICSSFNAG